MADRRLKVGDCGKHRHLTGLSEFNFEQSLGYEKGFRKMGAGLMQSCDKSQE